VKILITGGAGFIGSHLVDALVTDKHHVVVFDNLDPQVHGQGKRVPAYFNRAAEFVLGDVRDKALLSMVVADVDVVYHLAAATGVGQSEYEISHYVSVNVTGTANLLEALVTSGRNLKQFVLASSRAVYGEGKYQCIRCGPVFPKPRSIEQLERGEWEVACPKCGQWVRAVATDEDKPLQPDSIYAISKRTQEELCLHVGKAYGIPVVVLRFFNVYGPRQALSNPYTGILSVFSARLLNGKSIEIYEDGAESRDFVHVRDAVQACVLALHRHEACGQIINVGTGVATSILEIGRLLMSKLGVEAPPLIPGKFRVGDIRHCYADLTKATKVLGFSPQITLADGIDNLLAWVREQTPQDLSWQAERELIAKGLLRTRQNLASVA